jgi:hypothetical protein
MDILKVSKNRAKSEFDVYCGRKTTNLGFGNPFSHKKDSQAKFIVDTLEDSLIEYRKWLTKIVNLYNKGSFDLEKWEFDYAASVWQLAKDIKYYRVNSLVCWCVSILNYVPSSEDVEVCHTQILYKCCLALIDKKIV